MYHNYSNCTLVGIQNETERYALAGWLSVVALLSILGDTTILVASIRCNAFSIHKVVVAFIQHLAVCDLLTTLGNILPILISVMYNGPAASDKIVTYVWFFVGFYVYSVSPSLIAAMTFSKLLLLKYPLRAGSWSSTQIHKLCSGIWAALLSVPSLRLLVDKNDIVFDCRVYTYMYMYSSDLWKSLRPILALLTLFVPSVVVIVSTILLLIEAKRVVRDTQESLRWQGITTVILTATVYTLSYLPFTVYLAIEPYIEEPLTSVYVEFYRAACTVLTVNVLATFFVYSLTVTSFRGFLRTRFRGSQKRSVISVRENKVSCKSMRIGDVSQSPFNSSERADFAMS